MPLFRVKKEVLTWVKNGTKTIEIRKGNPKRGDVAFFSSGPYQLKLCITKKETGKINEVIRTDNYLSIIPTAKTPKEAIGYLQNLYRTDKGIFTAYYLSSIKQ
jgi:ASC-1-like (ASCH) protein